MTLCAPEVGMEVAAALEILIALASSGDVPRFESLISRSLRRHDDMNVG